MDSNGNPILFVLNPDSTRDLKKRKYNKVDYDQTASHLHHSDVFNIKLPEDFNMEKYKSLSKKDRIASAKQHVPRETIIRYQNFLGRAIDIKPRSSNNNPAVRGFAGKHKSDISLIIKSIPDTNNFYFSIINDKNTHITSFSIPYSRLRVIAKDDFHVLKDKTFN